MGGIEKHLNLTIFIYGKNSSDKAININKNLEKYLSKKIRNKIQSFIIADEKYKQEYVFQNEINKDSNDNVKN